MILGLKHVVWLFGALIGLNGLILKYVVNKELKRLDKYEAEIDKLKESQWKNDDMGRQVHQRLDKMNDKIHDILKIFISMNLNK